MLIAIPSFMVHSRSMFPFIEDENKWADKYPVPFLFEEFDLKNNKDMVVNYPDDLFNHASLNFVPSCSNYVKGTLFHSTDYNECYLTLSYMSFIPKNKTFSDNKIIKNLKVDKAFVNKLFEHCKMKPPFNSPDSYTENIIPQPQSYDEFFSENK